MEPVESRPDPSLTLPGEPLYFPGGRWGHKPGPLREHSPLSASFRHIQPSWRSYIEYVDLAARNGDTTMQRYRDCYAALTPKDRMHAWPEQVCELADVTPGELIGAVCRALWESRSAESSMVSAIAHPEVLARTAKLARTKDNYRDRELFFRLTGSLPDKKGASINIINNPTAQAGTVKLVDGEVSGNRLKSMDEEVIEMTRQLDTGPAFLERNVSPEGD